VLRRNENIWDGLRGWEDRHQIAVDVRILPVEISQSLEPMRAGRRPADTRWVRANETDARGETGFGRRLADRIEGDSAEAGVCIDCLIPPERIVSKRQPIAARVGRVHAGIIRVG